VQATVSHTRRATLFESVADQSVDRKRNE